MSHWLNFPVPNKPYVASEDVKQHKDWSKKAQELCESGGGRLGLPSLIVRTVSVDEKQN